MAIGLTRQDAAIEFLLTLIEEESQHTASAALDALGPLQYDERISARLEKIRR